MRLVVIIAASMAACAPALASGSTMPLPLPLPEETFESYAVCLTNLKNVHSLDVKRIDTAPQTREDGSVLRHSLTTEGVVETGPEAALYKAEYGTTVTATDEASKQIKHQYSWERTELNCSGPRLTGMTYQGYSQPLFEPAP